MFEQLAGMTCVLGGDHIALAKHAQGAERDIFKIPDGRGDEIKRSGHQGRQGGGVHTVI